MKSNVLVSNVVFYVVHKWSRDKKKNPNSRVWKFVTPFHTFFIFFSGIEKLNLIKTIQIPLSKVLTYKRANTEKPKVLLLTPTVVAAINFIDKQRSTLWNKL